MNEYIKKYYFYLIDNKDKKVLKEIKSYCKKNKIDFEKLTDKVTRSIAKLKFELTGLGYDLSLEGFNNILEDYIEQKENLNDKEKKRYLKLLVNLSKIYDIDLRTELLKNEKSKSIDPKIIRQFIEFHLGPKVNEEKINTLKDILQKNEISYDKLAKKYMPLINEIKEEARILDYDTDKESFKRLIDEYLKEKQHLDDEEKMQYLKLMFKLSRIYDIDIKNILSSKPVEVQEEVEVQEDVVEEKKENKVQEVSINLDLSNPLDNDLYLKKLLEERYTSGSFDIHSTHSDNYKEAKDAKYDSFESRIELINYLLKLYLDKISNYAATDINEDYQKLLEDNDIEVLNNITIEDLTNNIKTLLNNKEPKLSKNINILLKKLIEVTDYNDNIGTNNKNIFHNQSSKSLYTIYLNTSNTKETYSIINDYIKECINNNINYDMRPYDEIEKTYIYSSKEDLNLKLDILNNILSKYNIESFGTPVENTALINNTNYSISNIEINESSYNDYFIELLEVSYYRVLSKIVIEKIDNPQDGNIIEEYIKLSNITFDGNKTPFNIMCNKKTFSTIKDTVHKYIPEVITTLQKNFTEDELLDEITTEFKESIQYIYNISNDLNKTDNSNISVIL